MSDYEQTARNRVRRLPARGHYDQETIYAIVDEALYCHVGFVQDGQPFVIPTIHARMGDEIVLHGAKASRLLHHVQAGHQVCVAITLLDGLVLARSVFHHSMNYRSVVLYGRGRTIDSEREKLRALEVLTEHLVPGRWAEARQPNPRELQATAVVAIPIESASAKMRSGPPGDDEADYALPIWAGTLPFHLHCADPEADPQLAAGIPVPEYLARYTRGERPDGEGKA